MDHPTTLIYLFDEETLSNLFENWPSSMRVALCIDEEGGGHVTLLREDEAADAPVRIAQLLDRDDSDFVIVPTFGGYPTRKIRFSEEQQLCGMLAELSDLPLRARSHLAGLPESPDLCIDEFCEPLQEVHANVALTSAEETASGHTVFRPAVGEATLDEVFHAGWVEDGQPAITRSTSKLPEGFIHLTEKNISAGPSLIVGRLSRAGKHVQLTLEGAPLRQKLIEPYLAAEVGASRDLTRFCIVPPEGAPWPPEPGASILFDNPGIGPVSSQLSNGRELRVDVVVESDSLLLSLGDYEVILGNRRSKRFSRRALGPAFAALVAYAMFQVGMSEEAFLQMSSASLTVAHGDPEAVD